MKILLAFLIWFYWKKLIRRRRTRFYDLTPTQPQPFEHMPAYRWKWPTATWLQRRRATIEPMMRRLAARDK